MYRQPQQQVLEDANPNLGQPDRGTAVDRARFRSSKSSGEDDLPTTTGPIANMYSLSGTKRGRVLIFNHTNFASVYYSDRNGTQVDVQSLCKAFLRLGFQAEDIVEYKDKSIEEIYAIVNNLGQDKDLKKCDCLVMVILTHGERGEFLMAADGAYHLYEFLGKFTPKHIPSMAEKPKLFVIQACRGAEGDLGVQPSQASSGEDQIDATGKIHIHPEFSDFLIVTNFHHGFEKEENDSHATPDSAQNQQQGSWFIQDLCKAIEESDLETDSIFEILTDTNAAISKRITNNSKQQIPHIYSTLTKMLYFTPERESTAQ